MKCASTIGPEKMDARSVRVTPLGVEHTYTFSIKSTEQTQSKHFSVSSKRRTPRLAIFGYHLSDAAV